MRIPQEKIEGRLAEVPENVRRQVLSNEVANSLSKIASEHDLHIDQAGILDEETLYAMLGLQDGDAYISKLRERLGISEKEAEAIARDVNNRVFLEIRSSLMSGAAEPAQAEEVPAEEEPIGNKEDILAEIENPAPAVHPISIAAAGPAKPREVIPEPAKDPASQAFVAGKLSDTVSMPTQRTAELAKQEPSKGYAADPYREPLA